MSKALLLAETHTLPLPRGEVSDPDREEAPLAETQSITEVRGEVSDPDRGMTLVETQTFTKAGGEANDPDAGAFGGAIDWERGDRRPLLFRDAVVATREMPPVGYDDAIDMAVDYDGQSLIEAGMAPETRTETSLRLGETTDSDR